MTGSFTLFGSAVSLYVIGENLFKRFKPDISRNWLIAGPIVGGSALAYLVAWRGTVHCSNMWMAMEDQHSVLNPVQGASRGPARVPGSRDPPAQHPVSSLLDLGRGW